MSSIAALSHWDVALRLQAETRLLSGTRVTSPPSAADAQVLAQLMKLASDPETAGDALRLLHEIQVHQVELALQREQAETEHQDLQQRVAHYTALFEHSPVASVVLDGAGKAIEVNAAAAQWLGHSPYHCVGRAFEDLLMPESREAFRALLWGEATDGVLETCVVQGDGHWRPVRLKVAPAQALGPAMVVLLD